MKVIVLIDHSGIGDKNGPMDREAARGQIVEMNPNTANNWLIPAGVVAPATEENIAALRREMDGQKPRDPGTI